MFWSNVWNCVAVSLPIIVLLTVFYDWAWKQGYAKADYDHVVRINLNLLTENEKLKVKHGY